jgi:hypothetical protein
MAQPGNPRVGTRVIRDCIWGVAEFGSITAVMKSHPGMNVAGSAQICREAAVSDVSMACMPVARDVVARSALC